MRHRTVYGVGINDVDYPVVKNKCPYYAIWQAMLSRCYSKKGLAKGSTYNDCSVTHEWHTFSIFKDWMLQQAWEGRSLDKDLRIPGNRVYGPNTCLFVSQAVNSLLNIQPKQQNQIAMGVAKHGLRFKATIRKFRKTHHIGVFDTIEEAKVAYQNAKADWILEHAANEPCVLTKAALLREADKFRKGQF